ncbi:hypothetical protein Trydic_g4438 [Trypoxylus dichotomus]
MILDNRLTFSKSVERERKDNQQNMPASPSPFQSNFQSQNGDNSVQTTHSSHTNLRKFHMSHSGTHPHRFACRSTKALFAANAPRRSQKDAGGGESASRQQGPRGVPGQAEQGFLRENHCQRELSNEYRDLAENSGSN